MSKPLEPHHPSARHGEGPVAGRTLVTMMTDADRDRRLNAVLWRLAQVYGFHAIPNRIHSEILKGTSAGSSRPHLDLRQRLLRSLGRRPLGAASKTFSNFKIYVRDDQEIVHKEQRFDADIVGGESGLVPVELLSYLAAVLNELNLGGLGILRVGHRRLLDAAMDVSGVPRQPPLRRDLKATLRRAIEDGEVRLLEVLRTGAGVGLGREVTSRLEEYLNVSCDSRAELLQICGNLLKSSADGLEALAELERLHELLSWRHLSSHEIIFSTRCIPAVGPFQDWCLEGRLPHAVASPFVVGGGYAAWASRLLGRRCQAAGFSLDVTALHHFLAEKRVLIEPAISLCRVVFTIPQAEHHALRIADDVRRLKIPTRIDAGLLGWHELAWEGLRPGMQVVVLIDAQSLRDGSVAVRLNKESGKKGQLRIARDRLSRFLSYLMVRHSKVSGPDKGGASQPSPDSSSAATARA